ncbi:MAG: hypothetical protein LBB65_06330 [Burkholderiales bacterium]|jgi:hypothetical protein|nr:hypothetical protein [Burkholderiales bacterium]
MSLPVYPDLPLDEASKITGIRHGRLIGQTMDGSIAQTVTYPGEKLNFRAVHSYLVKAQWEALEQFYRDNLYTPFDMELDGVLRHWLFTAPPLAFTWLSPTLRTYTVDLWEL